MPWEDNLDDFERQLAADREQRKVEEEANHASREHKNHRNDKSDREYTRRRREHRHRHRLVEPNKRHHRRSDDHDENDRRHKRRRRSSDFEDEKHERQHRQRLEGDESPEPQSKRSLGEGKNKTEGVQEPVDNSESQTVSTERVSPKQSELPLRRDAWMENPSAIDVEYVRQSATSRSERTYQGSPKDVSANHHAGSESEDEIRPLSPLHKAAEQSVNYEFGDNGSRWRLMKLKNTYREADETGREVDDVALARYGSLRVFDDAREEEIEMDRRERYGEGYARKSKPSGELYAQRQLETNRHEMGQGAKLETDGVRKAEPRSAPASTELSGIGTAPNTSTPIDSTALNRLRAQLMKARLKGAPDIAELEAEYEKAERLAEMNPASTNIVIGVMENRMLAGTRQEVKDITTKRGRERGQVEDNDDMTIDDMVREERRTKGIFGNEDRRFASRIAKDGKFTNDLDYMEENASKLAKRVHQSDTQLRSSAISEHKQMTSTLASCPLCHQEDQPNPLPMAPLISLGHRSYLTLPTAPEISVHASGAIIVPLSHHENLLHCDDDEWEELRNFMKSLSRLYHSKGLGVLFYENAAHPRNRRHAALVAVPLPQHLAEDAPAFFKEAFLASDDEWTQHRKVIDTRGKGKTGFRRSIAKEAPYFHAWTELDGGLGHVVEDERRWPKGDLFAREIIGGGMLRVKPEVWRKQGRWDKSSDTSNRIDKFRRGWDQFDWTKMLLE